MGQAVRPQRLGQGLGQGLGIERTRAGERAWLSMLIDAMEQVSRRDVRTAPCDARLLAMVRLHLGRSVVAHRPINYAARLGHRTKRAI
jgi:hypothetical protein